MIWIKTYFTPARIRYFAPLAVCLALIAVLLCLPTGHEGAETYRGADRVPARVLATDDSAIVDTGLVRSGEQSCTVLLEDGHFSGETVEAVNMLTGSLEQDKLFSTGDRALVLVSYSGEEILTVTMVDHWRITGELALAAAFMLFLVFFSGKTGLRAIFSFVLTVLMLWKVLVPLYLAGAQPIVIGLAVSAVLTVMIIALVYGFDRRTAAAVSGAMLGLLVTCVLGVLFTDLFNIHGAVMEYSESLLYSGYQTLDLTQIFMASIFIGSSGAVMDLSVDITSAVCEVVRKRPDITSREAIRSGMNVGRAAMGTMTTTLLLAYSGGYIALLMVFMAQGTPLINIFNYKYVASEILDTIVGSFGLVTVAPFTALAAGWILTRKGAAASLAEKLSAAADGGAAERMK